ncbi:ATP-binding cassette transporter subfamily A [Pelomyxa schiedti]|nr:ATP-binding cassette transporter subfamily A [Pelomyxa schiedti]
MSSSVDGSPLPQEGPEQSSSSGGSSTSSSGSASPRIMGAMTVATTPPPDAKSHVAGLIGDKDTKLEQQRARDMKVGLSGAGTGGVAVLQLWAAFKKCALIKLRNIVFTLIEIFSPLLLIGPILAGYFAAGNDYHPAQIYVNTTFPPAVPEGMVCVDPRMFVDLPSNQSYPPQCFNLLDALNYTGPMPLLGFDEFMTAHYMLYDAFIGNSTYEDLPSYMQSMIDDFGNLIRMGKLFFACGDESTAIVKEEVDNFEQYMLGTSLYFSSIFGGTFPTEQEALDWVHEHPGETWAVVVFYDLNITGGNVDYNIRLNWTQVPYTADTVNSLLQGMDTTFLYYFFSGFLTLQAMVAEYTTNLTDMLGGTLFYSPFPIKSYTDNIFYLFIGPFLGMVMVLTTLYPASRLVKEIVEEKENCIKETLRMMGMPLWVNSLSWCLTYIIVFGLTALAETILECLTFFPNTSGILMFIFNFLFLLSILAFSVMMSTIFSRAKLAGVVCPLALFAAVIPRYLFMSSSEDQLIPAKLFTSLLSPSAFAFGCDSLANYEYAQQGINRYNMWDGPYPFVVSIVILAIDITLYSLIAWYLEHVLPSQYGIHKPPYFLCTPEYWRGHRWDLSFEHDEVESGDSVEVVDSTSAKKAVVRIRNLTKRYSDGKLAVNNLYLTMYSDQITCLLGHNGAGKSTTISMLTGLLQATSGDCYIGNNSVTTDMGRIRRSLGVCPQRNVIFPQLTVKEHLVLVGIMKGVPFFSVDSAAMAMVRLVGLKGKQHSKAGHLSGGMKRKLCMGMALMGGSKVVVLDEPTSGMDPYSRRATWDLLRQCKKERVILLTTHYMDEADLLGDRIAVMSAGQLQCVGSSLFLKTRYGLGYTLTIAKEENAEDSAISNVVSSVIPDSRLTASNKREITFCLPLAAVGSFAQLFKILDSKEERIGLESYGVTMTTLEQVFLKLAEENEKRLEEQDEQSGKPFCCCFPDKLVPESPKSNDTFDDEEPDVMEWDKPYKAANPWVQFKEMMKKRFITSRRDTKGILFQLLVPVITVALVLLMLKIKIDPAGPKLYLTPAIFDMELHRNNPDKSEMTYAQYSPSAPTFMPFFETTNLTSTAVPVTDSLELSEWLLNASSHPMNRFGAFAFGDFLYSPAAPGPVAATLLHNVTSAHAIPVFLNELCQSALAIASGLSKDVVRMIVSSQPLPLSGQEEQDIATLLSALAALFMLVPFSFVAANFVIFIVKERAVKAKHLQMTCGVNIYSFWVANIAWDTICFFIVTCLVMVVFGIYRNDSFVGTVDRFFATALLIFFYGVTSLCVSYTLSFLFTSAMGAQLGIAGITFIFGFGLVLASVILDTLPKTMDINPDLKHLYRIFPPYLFGEGLINLSSAPSMDQVLGVTRNAFDWDIAGRSLTLLLVEGLFYFVVTLCIDNGFFKWIIVSVYRKMKYCCRSCSKSGRDTTGVEMSHTSNTALSALGLHSGEDEDVVKERKRVTDMLSGAFSTKHPTSESAPLKADSSLPTAHKPGSSNLDAITIYNLRKVFGFGSNAKVAVNNITLGIPRGECFGFLGTNGAGKTTTLSMLTHDLTPTSGDAWISGYSVVTDFNVMQSEVGYCPQFDPLLDKMTGREHLRLFGRLKGIPITLIEAAVQQLIDFTGLSHYADKVAEAYSGGNKRKLSLAIALIGAPRVVFLDEPSSGMDPVARRSMWTVIQKAALTKSIVITSHSMEETEALCTRVGILVGGSFRCLGSIQHLKTRFGNSLFVEIKTTEERVEDVEQWVQTTFKGAEIAEKHVERLKYIIPNQGGSLSTVFAGIESAKVKLQILEYSVCQPTLEQIFVSIARQQEEAEADAEAVDTPTATTPTNNKSSPEDKGKDKADSDDDSDDS